MSISFDKKIPDKKSIKVLVFDLDGTLLAPGAILTDRALKAVKACQSLGIRIVIATGRGSESAERYRALLGAEGPMIYFNGVMVAEMPEGKILKSTLLNTQVAEYCVDLSREMGVYCQIYFPYKIFPERVNPSCKETSTILLTERDGPELEFYCKHTDIRPELADLKEALKRAIPGGCVKAMFLAEPEIQAVLRRRLEERFGGTIYIAASARTYLEIMDAKVSKGQGLKFLMEHLSLKSEEVIAFGDEENDSPMFSAAGFSVAPLNAKDSVKAQADLIVGSNAEDGVAAFLEGFFGL